MEGIQGGDFVRFPRFLFSASNIRIKSFYMFRNKHAKIKKIGQHYNKHD